MKALNPVQMKAAYLSNTSEHQPTMKSDNPWVKTPAERQEWLLRNQSRKKLPGYIAHKVGGKAYGNTSG